MRKTVLNKNGLTARQEADMKVVNCFRDKGEGNMKN